MTTKRKSAYLASKNRTDLQAKVLFTDSYTWKNFHLQFFHLVNRLLSYSQDAKIVNQSAMCNHR